MRRFINADLLHGDITNSLTLNRYAYCNGDPVNGIDPMGLSVERGTLSLDDLSLGIDVGLSALSVSEIANDISDYVKYGYYIFRCKDRTKVDVIGGKIAGKSRNFRKSYYNVVKISKSCSVDDYWTILKNVHVKTGLKNQFSFKLPSGKVNTGAILSYVSIALDAGAGIYENVNNGTRAQKIVSDAVVDVGTGLSIVALSTMAGSAIGSVVPVAGNIVGGAAGFVIGLGLDFFVNADFFNDQSVVDLAKEGAAAVADGIVDFCDNVGDTIGGWFTGIFS